MTRLLARSPLLLALVLLVPALAIRGVPMRTADTPTAVLGLVASAPRRAIALPAHRLVPDDRIPATSAPAQTYFWIRPCLPPGDAERIRAPPA